MQEIRRMINKGLNNSEIARQFQVYPSTIGYIRNKKTWKHLEIA